MSIKNKLLILSSLTIIGFILIFSLDRYTVHEVEDLNKAKIVTEKIKSYQEHLQLSQINFLNEKKEKYADDFMETDKKIDILLKELELILSHYKIHTSSIDSYHKKNEEYGESFRELVSLQSKIGLDHKSGLYGKLRDSVHKVQDYAKKSQNYELLSTVYELRKHEKDFMLRYDKKYLDKFNSVIDKLLIDIEPNDIKNDLIEYKKDFNLLVQNEEAKGFNNSSGVIAILNNHKKESYILIKELEDLVLTKTKEEINFIENISLSVIIIIALLVIILSFYFSKSIINSIKKFQIGIIEFFSYLNKETKVVNLLDESGKDEVAHMSKLVNTSIVKIKDTIESENRLILEATEVAKQISQGYLDKTITMSSSNESLNQFKDVINEMLRNLNNSVHKVLDVLENYTNYNYVSKVDTTNLNGEILALCEDTNKLGDSITELLMQNQEFGNSLSQSSQRLLEEVENLTTSSNTTAASLEESAAALEEITSTIISNTNNVENMTRLAKEVNNNAKEGEALAKDTTTAMENINIQVSSISDAITVIDQIAFQTNILSLNAAVEAATAGEAGSGFAVVAGEVRNLANRSSEAAKEIKNIVELATSKANEGITISAKMIDGYNKLNSNISETISIIDDVSTASKEQQSGIEQINDSISNLDQQTQQNAMVANEAKDIATNTNTIAEEIVDNLRDKNFIGKM